MSDALCTKYGCDYQLDLDGQVTCTNCGAMDDDMSGSPTPSTSVDTGDDAILNENISSSYNGRRAVSETDNEGPIPSLEAMFESQIDFE